MVVQGQFLEPAVCFSNYITSLYKIRSEIQGKITGPLNIGHGDLQRV